jgi:hypothetical protein
MMLRDTIPMVWWQFVRTERIPVDVIVLVGGKEETDKLCFDTTLYYGSFSAVLIHRFYQEKISTIELSTSTHRLLMP